MEGDVNGISRACVELRNYLEALDVDPVNNNDILACDNQLRIEQQ
jgi:hypothetical protein